MENSRVPELVTKHRLRPAICDLLHEVERGSGSVLAENLDPSRLRFGIAEKPAPILSIKEGRIRITNQGRFIEVPQDFDPADQIRCGACVMEFRAEMTDRRTALDYLMMREPSKRAEKTINPKAP